MIKIKYECDETGQEMEIGFTNNELRQLRHELETIFILSNGTASTNSYSLEKVRKETPLIAELFTTIYP